MGSLLPVRGDRRPAARPRSKSRRAWEQTRPDGSARCRSATSATASTGESRCGRRSKRSRDAKQVACPGAHDGGRRPAPGDVLTALAAFPLERSGSCRGFVAGAQATTVAWSRRRNRGRPVIGTHRLLSGTHPVQAISGPWSSTRNSDSGVATKARLKLPQAQSGRPDPCPRRRYLGRFNLARAGIRPAQRHREPHPGDRLPIQTRVAEATAGLVRDAHRAASAGSGGGRGCSTSTTGSKRSEAQAEQTVAPPRMLPAARSRRWPRSDGRGRSSERS